MSDGNNFDKTKENVSIISRHVDGQFRLSQPSTQQSVATWERSGSGR